jgi:dTDP-4-amino-4,6-dideoxygalactose transaminase
MRKIVPFNRPHFFGEEYANIRTALESAHISGNGAFTKICESWLENRLGVPRTILTTSCTDALEMCSLLLDLQPDDEVIVPSYTFVSSANAFVLHGAKPVFADIRPDTLNIDHEKIKQLISQRTKAIIVVHYAGVACEMDAILEVAKKHEIAVIEDNAHGLFGTYRGRPLGTLGSLATLSFHETKNVSCGEGGALIINNERFIERAEVLRDKGTNRSHFYRGQVDKYTWVDKGSSFLPSDLLAAILAAQLEHATEIQEKRKEIWNLYFEELQDWAAENGVGLPTVPQHVEQAYHMFYILLPSLQKRQDLIKHLEAHGVRSAFHYIPLHSSLMGQRFNKETESCPVSSSTSDRLLRLPFFFDLTDSQQRFAISRIREFKC